MNYQGIDATVSGGQRLDDTARRIASECPEPNRNDLKRAWDICRAGDCLEILAETAISCAAERIYYARGGHADSTAFQAIVQ